MGRLTTNLRRWRRWISSRRGTPRHAMVGTVVLILGGAAWLGVSASSARRLDVDLGVSLPAPALAEASERLRRSGIRFQVRQGRLFTRSSDAALARTLTEPSSPSAPCAMETLQRLADREDLWQSSAQSDRRWLVARMSALSDLVSAFPAIRSATVLLEKGSPSRLGRAGVAPSAAVQVSLEPGRVMTPALAAAVAEIVAGGVAGLTRKEVRIVDSAGRVCRLPEETDQTSRAIAAIEAAEAYYSRRIRSALEHIEGLTVTVHVDAASIAGGAIPPCGAARVSVPWSPERGSLDAGGVAGELAAAFVADVRNRAADAAGIADPQCVRVQSHAGLASIPWTPSGTSPAHSSAQIATILGALVLSGAGVLSAALVRRRRSRNSSDESSTQPADSTASSAAAQTSGVASVGAGDDESLAFLQELSAEQLVALLRREHPQTMAAVLGSLPPGRAAAVLASLEPQKQVDVIRRLAASEAMDPEVVREVSRALRDRLARTNASSAGDGVSAVAEILNHADYASERTVLEGLSSREPELADSILRRMFEFDDILALSDVRLRAALESVAPEEIAVALRTAGPEICTKVLAALPPDEAEGVREEMEQIGPVRLSDVEAAQQRLAAAVRRSDTGRYVSDTADEATRAMA
jgi:flagellar motor switch protein FliG